MTEEYIYWLDGTGTPLVAQVGGKGSSLLKLRTLGLTVPDAFIVTTAAFRAAIPTSVLAEIDRLVTSYGAVAEISDLHEIATRVRELVFAETEHLPARAEIVEAYIRLGERLNDAQPAVAVRSSSVAEDSHELAFAGQHDSYLSVIGSDQLYDAVRKCWASMFTARAITYRTGRGQLISNDAMAVVVQQMVDARVAGVFMTLNPVNGDRSKIVIETVWGLGEPLVSGTVTPDRFVVDKVTREVLERTIATKVNRAGVGLTTGQGIIGQPVGSADQERPSLTAKQLDLVIDVARAVDADAGCAQDGEFAFDGDDLYMLQSRPVTVSNNRPDRRSGTEAGPEAISEIVNVLVGDSIRPRK